ncbi:MAG: transketolase family protein [Anaerolineae bacterium]
MKGKLTKSTRRAYGETLVELGRENPDIVALDADLCQSTMSGLFGKEFPDRFFDMGIAEANMIGVAAGLASCGKIPFVSTFAIFASGRDFDQVRMSVAYPELNVKIVASHGGITVGEDGASHHAIEDVALFSALPGFTIIVPADAEATRTAVRAAAELNGPVYIRLTRPSPPVVYKEGFDFTIGRANILRQGTDLTIVTYGLMVSQSLQAAESLEEEGIEAHVLDMHTIKPLDEEAILQAVTKTGALVVAEEHLRHGGLGSAVASFVAEHQPAPIEFVAIRDTYAESGRPHELLAKYGLTADNVAAAARKVLRRRQKG